MSNLRCVSWFGTFETAVIDLGAGNVVGVKYVFLECSKRTFVGSSLEQDGVECGTWDKLLWQGSTIGWSLDYAEKGKHFIHQNCPAWKGQGAGSFWPWRWTCGGQVNMGLQELVLRVGRQYSQCCKVPRLPYQEPLEIQNRIMPSLSCAECFSVLENCLGPVIASGHLSVLWSNK